MPIYTHLLVSLAPHVAQILWHPKDMVDDETCTSTADVQLLSYICDNNPSILLNHCIILLKIVHHSCRQYVPTKYPYAHFIWTQTLLIRYITASLQEVLYHQGQNEIVPLLFEKIWYIPRATKSVAQSICKCETEVIMHKKKKKNPIFSNLLVFISTTFFCRFQ
jgi:hypothetical protein